MRNPKFQSMRIYAHICAYMRIFDDLRYAHICGRIPPYGGIRPPSKIRYAWKP